MKTMNTRLLTGLAAILLICGAATSARAADTPSMQANLGGMFGLNAVDKDVGGGVAFGLQGSYYLNDYLGVGAWLRAGYHDNGVTSATFGADALYRLKLLIPGAQVGAMIGSAKFSANGFSGNAALYLGALAGYDYAISPMQPVTVGGELTLGFTKPGTSTLLWFTGMATLKWWF